MSTCLHSACFPPTSKVGLALPYLEPNIFANDVKERLSVKSILCASAQLTKHIREKYVPLCQQIATI